MNLFIIILIIAIVATVLLYIAFKNAEELPEEEKTSFQPRKVTYISTETEIPKKKYYKKRNKKKKPAVAQNDTTEKRPVGRPRKTTE